MVNGGCSGFIGFPNVVITAAHCIDGVEDVQQVRFYDGLKGDFKVIKIGEPDHTDFALLLGDTRGIDPLPLAKKPPAYGERCYSIGHGGGNPKQMLLPCETRPPLPIPWHRYVGLHSNIIGGDSGSFVANEEDEVFGIIVRSSFPVPVALAVKIRYAQEAYRDYLNEKQ